MPSHPQIEEVEDSDVEMSDPSEGDIDDFAETDILRRIADNAAARENDAAAGGSSSSRQQPGRYHPQQPQARPAQQQFLSSYSSSHMHTGQLPPRPGQMFPTAPHPTAYVDFQCLYPVYFDASRTRAEGRRVSKALAVPNPLATQIMRACESLGLPTVLEATKLHPKDWANPGRVKIALKKVHENPALLTPGIGAEIMKNKHHLYVHVARHMRAHPTAEDGEALRFRVPGAPPIPEADKPWPRPAVPRGWKMAEFLPHYSPALSGGGVSENLLKDMLKEMGGRGNADVSSMLMGMAGAGGPGMPGMSGMPGMPGGSSGSSGPVGGGNVGGGDEKRKKDRKGKGKG